MSSGNAARPLLEMRDIIMTVPGSRALDGATFDLRRSELHALVSVWARNQRLTLGQVKVANS